MTQHAKSMAVVARYKGASQRASVESIEFSAPWPPTVNHYWARNKNGSVRIGKAGQLYRTLVLLACLGHGRISGKIGISIRAAAPDKRQRDLDNILKALLDAIAHCGVIENDFDIDEIHVYRMPPVKGGNVEVSLRKLL